MSYKKVRLTLGAALKKLKLVWFYCILLLPGLGLTFPLPSVPPTELFLVGKEAMIGTMGGSGKGSPLLITSATQVYRIRFYTSCASPPYA